MLEEKLIVEDRRSIIKPRIQIPPPATSNSKPLSIFSFIWSFCHPRAEKNISRDDFKYSNENKSNELAPMENTENSNQEDFKHFEEIKSNELNTIESRKKYESRGL